MVTLRRSEVVTLCTLELTLSDIVVHEDIIAYGKTYERYRAYKGKRDMAGGQMIWKNDI